MDINSVCEFSNPIWASSTWQFSELSCTTSIPYLEEYSTTSGTSSNAFYFSNVITSGDVILVSFFLILLSFILFKFIWHFVTERIF